MSRPFVMLGALRSGTTVFRLMLNAHNEINAPGETDFIFDYLHRAPTSNRWTCDVEKLRRDRIFQSQNLAILDSEDGVAIAKNLAEQLSERARGYLCLCIHGNAEKAAAIFPGSKVIHLIRDPRDVARSCIGMGWAGNTYYGVDQWLETERNWDLSRSLLGSQNVMEVRFEELIWDTQAQLEHVCRFLGVAFLPAMLTYSAHSTYAPPDPTAIQQWKLKLSSREVALVEIKAKTLLLQRKYELSGFPLNPPSLGEKLTLFWTNKNHKWKFGFDRYGPTLFILEKLTRRLATPFHYIFQRRIDEIDRKHLK